jgi:hypothetical protein
MGDLKSDSGTTNTSNHHYVSHLKKLFIKTASERTNGPSEHSTHLCPTHQKVSCGENVKKS